MGIKKHLAPASLALSLFCGSAQVEAQPPAPAPVPPPAFAPAPQPTLWNMLGIPQAGQRLRDARVNRNGNNPGRERKPPLTRIADPKNLASPNPAIKKAAEIKAEEDLCKQKVKAIKYLGQMGCDKCYGGVTEALMDALDDCTEAVRYEAAKAIKGAVTNHCAACSNKCCCTPDMMKKLAAVAYDKDDEGCWVEKSDRVRQAACEALMVCCPMGMPLATPVQQQQLQPPPDDTIREVPLPPDTPEAAVPAPVPADAGASRLAPPSTTTQTPQPAIRSDLQSSRLTQGSAESIPGHTKVSAPSASGTVAWVSQKSGGVRLRLNDGSSPEVGRRLQVYRPSETGTKYLGDLEIIKSEAKNVMARPVGTLTLEMVAHGDEVVLVAGSPSATLLSQVSTESSTGSVAWVSQRAGTIRIRLSEDCKPEVGKRVQVYHHSESGSVCLGELEIIRLEAKGIMAQPVGDLKLTDVSNGDEIHLSSKDSAPAAVRQAGAQAHAAK